MKRTIPSTTRGRTRGRRLVTVRRLVLVVAILSLSVVALAAARVGLVQQQSLSRTLPQIKRRSIIRMTENTLHCQNTLGASANIVADSRGNVCQVARLGTDGCCCSSIEMNDEEAFSSRCDTCQGDCCQVYEQCVACCMSVDSSTTRLQVRKQASHAILGLATDDFSLCKFRCLTNSGSVLHQNSYRNKLKHCFGTQRSQLDPSMSINSVDFETAFDDIDTDLQDPYLAGRLPNGSFNFPCKVQGCSIPEQDRELLHKERRAAQIIANSKRKDKARRGKRASPTSITNGKNERPPPPRLRGNKRPSNKRRQLFLMLR